MKKKALAVISFGTTCPEARKAIEQVEKFLADRQPDYELYRAFTSRMVINKIRRNEGIEVLDTAELMELLQEKGYDEVACQSLHVIPGVEYEKMCKQIGRYSDRFEELYIGQPLLFSEEDYSDCCEALMRNMPAPSETEAVVYMGHGSEHPMNAAYSMLENMFRARGLERVYVGTVEGFPGIEYILQRLKKHSITKVYLHPFMVTAGNHAKNDMAGEKNSWRSAILDEGYQVDFSLNGMGLFPEIADIFARHLMKKSV